MQVEFYHRKAKDSLNLGPTERLYVGRVNLGKHDTQNKVNFIKELAVRLSGDSKKLNINVFFWHLESEITSIISALERTVKLVHIIDYKGAEEPGQLKVLNASDDIFKVLLTNHLNYEQALDFSLNLRIQIYSNTENKFCLDVYDDRGLDVYIGMQ